MFSLPTVVPELVPSAVPPAVVHGLYVHVPFCFHKCHYCDFYSITRQTDDRMDRFVDLVLTEADLWTGDGRTIRPRTVFFGGGTPTLLPPDQMQRLIDGLRERFDLSDVDEWTIEANPATVTDDYCRMLRRHGVNRISFGAQSFNPAELKTLERHHDPDDVRRSLESARAAGFDRINLDMIFALPGQSLQSWSESLETALSLGTDHLSCYALTFEPNTAIAVRRRLGRLTPVPESLELTELHHTRDRLGAAGLPAYEVSNFARPGGECRHNVNYWTGGNYLGLGPSAASHMDGRRWKNRPHLGEWESSVGNQRLPTEDVELLSPRERAGEMAMLMLRLADGLNLGHCSDVTGVDAKVLFAEVVGRMTRVGLVEQTGANVVLTRKGLDVADGVAAEFLAAAND